MDRAEQDYEQAEKAYLDGLRAKADHDVLAGLASAVAASAGLWNMEAYAVYHATPSGSRLNELDARTEVTEVLDFLWSDIARAYAPETNSSRAGNGTS